MIELIENIKTWFSANGSDIRTVLEICLVLIVSIVFVLTVKHKKTVAKIKSIVDNLTEIVDDYKTIMTNLSAMKDTIEKYDVTTNKTISKMTNVEDVDTQLLKKLNAVLDILALAYSTIKNDEVRLGIANTVNYAKYLDPTNELIKKREDERKFEETSKLNEVKEEPKIEPVIVKGETVSESKNTSIRRC